MAQIFDIDGQTINPATEEKQDDLIALFGTSGAADMATEEKQDDIIAKMIVAPATEAKQDDIITAIGGATGLPVYGTDAVGADAYAEVVVSSNARASFYLHVSVEDNGAIISLDGAGATDHFAIPANTERLFMGLAIGISTSIQAKNLSAGNNYTNVRISVW